jgi:hypothetical protein
MAGRMVGLNLNMVTMKNVAIIEAVQRLGDPYIGSAEVDNISLSRASEFGCEFGWPRARGGCLGELAPIPGANRPNAKLAYPLHRQHLVQP